MIGLKIIPIVFLFLALCCSCERNDNACYDQSLKHNNACTTDCPGVCGCDGFDYCNECEANRNGITVVSNQPCPQ